MHKPEASTPQIRENQNKVYTRLISNVNLMVHGENMFRQVQERVLKWVIPQIGKVVPDEAWEGKSFDIEMVGAQPTSAVSIEQPRYWALQFNNADKTTPGRTWTTEVSIAPKEIDGVVLGCRLLCSHRGSPPLVNRTIPNFVRKIIFPNTVSLDGRHHGADPWWVCSREEVEELLIFINSETRKHPVVVISLPTDSRNIEDTNINVTEFLRATVGYVHTVLLTQQAAFHLSEKIGNEFTVYNKGIRTYLPNFDADSATQLDCPLATSRTIENWEEDHDTPFLQFLINQSLRVDKPREELEKEHPPFFKVKKIAKHLQRETAKAKGSSDADLLELAEEEIELSRKEVEVALSLAATAEKERDDAIAVSEERQQRYRNLQSRVDHLERQLIAKSKNTVPIPNDLNNFESWCQKHMAGVVVIHPRAIKSVKSTDFENIELIYKALLLLKDYYVPMRKIGGAKYVDSFNMKSAELGLDNTKCFSQKNKAQTFGGEYFITYNGDRCELKWHLRGSSARNERYGFRLYYFWDNDSSQVVVGYLPGHLKNAAT